MTAPPFRLDLQRTPPRAARGAALAQIDYALRELRRGDAEAIHEARKACKRLRALLRLLRPFLGASYKTENRRLRDAGRSLSAGRDATVVVEAARRLYGDASGASLRRLPASLGKAVGGGDRVAIGQARRRLEVQRRRIAAWPLATLTSGGLLPGLLDGYRRAQGAWRAARRRPTAVNLHEWRKQAKYHGYQCELLAPVWPGVAGARQPRMDRLAHELGWHHDLVVLAAALRRHGLALGDSDTLWLARRAIGVAQRRAARRALALGKTLFADTPPAWLSRHAIGA